MSRVKLDFFSLPWMGDDPRQSRSAGLMAVEYQGKLDRQLMETTIVDLMLNYPFFCSTISEEDGAYFFEVPDNLTRSDIQQRIHYTTEPFDELFARVSMVEFDLLTDQLYQMYLIDQGDSFILMIFGSHLMGDGLTTSTVMTLLFYNYYLDLTGRSGKLFPQMEYRQILEYTSKMRHTRFGLLWVPRFLRFIPGFIYYRRNLGKETADQVFNEPARLEDPIYIEKYILNGKFHDILAHFKARGNNSNQLITALVAYCYMRSQQYDSTICTYPINIRNKYGFEAGNLLTANSVTFEYTANFEEFVSNVAAQLNREKKKTGPIYALTLARFLKSDFESVRARMKGVIAASNLRVSNVGKLPAQNLQEVDHDIFAEIPLNNYHATALPMTNIGAHFFITSITNATANDYYLTILHYDRTRPYVKQVTDAVAELIEEIHTQLSTQ